MEEKKTLAPDPWDDAINPPARDFEIYGQVKVDVYYLFFPGGGQAPVPFDPNNHPEDKRATQIEMQIIPIAEQNISWDVKQKYLSFSKEWQKITLPSIKDTGVTDLRTLKDRFARIAQVPGFRPRKDKNTGEDTGEFWSTFKFIEVYPDEATCKAAFGGSPASKEAEQEAVPNVADQERSVMLTFAKVIVADKARTITDREELIKVLELELANNVALAKHFTVNTPEIQALIDEAIGSKA